MHCAVLDASTQTHIDAVVDAVEKDHSYCADGSRVFQKKRAPTMVEEAVSESAKVAPCNSVEEFCQDSEQVDEVDYQSSVDPDYDPSETDCDTDSYRYFSDSEELDYPIPGDVPQNPAEQRKFLVFESSIMELFVRCPQPICLAKVVSLERSLSGSRLIVKTRCADRCSSMWSSQPTVKKMGAGNLLLSAAVLFSGNTYIVLYDIADHLHMPIVGETQFYNIQKRYLFPVVNETWLSMQTAMFDSLGTVDKIVMSGDGRCDSPGHCAKYMHDIHTDG